MTAPGIDASISCRTRRGPRVAGASLFRFADRHIQRPDALDPAFDLVTRHHRGDAGRRPRHDDVAGAERDLLRQLPDDLRHAPDQFGEVALLPLGAVDREPYLRSEE